MSLDRAKAALVGTRFAEVEWVADTGSTNADLLRAARDGAGERARVADHQSAGRGRLDRRWEAPPGASLLMSVLVHEPFPATGPQLLGTALGVAAVDALAGPTGLAGLAGVEVGLKWPNDVVAPGAGPDGEDLKLGGLLSELVSTPGGSAVVVGLGLNLTWPDGFPEELTHIATAVNLLGGRVDREDLVVALLEAMHRTSELTDPGACEALMSRYRELCVTLGRSVRVELPRETLEGRAVDVVVDGSLVVEVAGTLRLITAGDVVHLRPTD